MKKTCLSFLLLGLFCFPLSANADPFCQHQWKETIITEPTCGWHGLKSKYCSLCHEYETVEIPATGAHVMNEWRTLIPSTCVSEGTQYRSCENCVYSESRSIPATGIHTWGDWQIEKYSTCTTSGDKIRECLYCTATQHETIPASGHDWSDWELLKNPSCTSDGADGRFCIDCLAEETRSIPDYGGHKFGKWRTIQKSTIFKYGKKAQYCSRCDYRKTKRIPKLKKSKAQTQVISMMKNYFSAAKKYNTSKLKSFYLTPSKAKLFIQKKYTAKFIRKYNKYLKYDFKSVSIKGNSATVKVSCRYYDATNTFYNSMDDMFKYILRNGGKTTGKEDYIQYKSMVRWNKYFGKEYTTKTITFKLRKRGGKWKIQTQTQAILNMLHCNYQTAYNDYFA